MSEGMIGDQIGLVCPECRAALDFPAMTLAVCTNHACGLVWLHERGVIRDASDDSITHRLGQLLIRSHKRETRLLKRLDALIAKGKASA